MVNGCGAPDDLKNGWKPPKTIERGEASEEPRSGRAGGEAPGDRKKTVRTIDSPQMPPTSGH